MNIHLATDHAGYDLKEKLKPFIESLGHQIIDHGTFSAEPCDYPDFIVPCAQALLQDSNAFGIILGGSGQGEAMCANRIHGIRATVYYGGPAGIVNISRGHNNANMLSLGARFISEEEAQLAIKTFLESPFTGEERHVRRIEKF